MAIYEGKITLVDMSEIAEAGMLYTWIMYSDDPYADNPIITSDPTNKKYIGISYNQQNKNPSYNPEDYRWSLFKGEDGVKIVDIKNYYAISINGVVPPVDKLDFQIIDDNLYLSENEKLLLVVEQNLLGAVDPQGNKLAFNLEKEQLAGIGTEWTENIPEVPKGSFLWTKIVTYYSDDTTTVQFLSSYQGQDGEKGQDASKFKFEFNQNEILKFVKDVQSGVKTSISPGNLIITVIEDDIYSEEQFKQVRDLDPNKFSMEIYNINTGVWSVIDNSLSVDEDQPFITIDSTDNFNIDLNSLVEQEISSESVALRTLVQEECILKFTYSHQVVNTSGVVQTYNIVDFLNVRYGMNRDMATLQLGAKDIVASVQNSKLTFSAEGLSVTNGGFRIINKVGKDVLYCDENGNVSMIGHIEAESGSFKGHIEAESGTFAGELAAATGTFSGELKAASGSFSGDIEAKGGTIGGFRIEGNHLASTKTDTIDNISGVSRLYLDGEEGFIKAADIRLTGTMTISDSIVLKKPENSEDSFIRVRGDGETNLLLLKADGSIQVGNNDNAIIINGAEGSIMSKSYENGLGWKITNGRSVFNDVTVKGSIRASVLEYGEVQAIGGELLVRPSTRIISSQIVEMALVDEGETSTDNNCVKVYVEEVVGFNMGDMCRFDYQSATEIVHKYCTIQSVSQINDEEKWIVLESIDGPITMDLTGKPLVSLGQKEDNIGISINGSVSDAFSVPQSLSVFEFDYIKKVALPRIILGKLPSQDIYGNAAGTYGLYAENVLLKGSLVTTFGDSTGEISSGIRTLFDGDSPDAARTEAAMNFENPGEILLWAGAKGTSAEAIEGSKFFVDKNGNLFAGSGYFKGTIISDATITASVIETVTIRGKNQDENIIEYGSENSGDGENGEAATENSAQSLAKPALTIEDATRGIHFRALESNLLSDNWFEWATNKKDGLLFLYTKKVLEVEPGQEYSLNFRIKAKKVNIYFYDEAGIVLETKTISKSMQDFIYFTPPSGAKKVLIELYIYDTIEEYQANLGQIKPFLGKYKTVFQVNKDSIIANVAEFVLNGDLKIKENGSILTPKLYVTDNETNDAVIIGKKEISYVDDFNNTELTSSGAKGSINFDSDGLAFSTGDLDSILDLSGTNINVNGVLQINKTVYYGEKVKYQPAYINDILVGYDLYVE